VTRQAASAYPLRQRCGIAAAALALLVLAGCSTNGDFGRVRLKHDGIHDWMGEDAAGVTRAAPWQHHLTDEERRLRDLAYPLIEPPYDRQRWYSVLTEHGWVRPHPPDRTAYASRLFQTAYRSQTARYNKVMDDIRNDMTRMDPFFGTARYVADMDRRRERSLAYVSALTREERDNTIQRMRENDGVIRWTQASLRERVASYQLALERLVIAAPSPMAVETERTLMLFQQKLAAYGV
jgi:hypothetical protein